MDRLLAFLRSSMKSHECLMRFHLSMKLCTREPADSTYRLNPRANMDVWLERWSKYVFSILCEHHALHGLDVVEPERVKRSCRIHALTWFSMYRKYWRAFLQVKCMMYNFWSWRQNHHGGDNKTEWPENSAPGKSSWILSAGKRVDRSRPWLAVLRLHDP